jgi:hypothetical protein
MLFSCSHRSLAPATTTALRAVRVEREKKSRL